MTAAATTSSELDRHRASLIAAVGAVVPEPVLDAAPLNRRGLYTNKALGRFGFLPYLLGKAQAGAQAGGLPEQFALAVTATRVYVLRYRTHGRRRDRYEAGEQLAVWDRDGLRVTWQNGPPYQIDVTIETGDGEPILCRCGRTPWSEGILRLLAQTH